MVNKERYFKIIEEICAFNNVSREEIIEMFKEKEIRYLFILFLKKYNCWSEENIKYLLKVKTSKSINYNYRKAEEKLLINKKFRDKYFEIEKKINSVI
ncbi:hypothetical protein J2Z53_002260 [Clostridium moniliforme]|uniref:Ribose-5-phosphate isomerase n=1 Tax=Clostridium moniliforme TaxID=39489 RepID=A0ABS4F316_9CLOT|nr:hypothetical protein [Clostridium moniliforme]MBP1890651.1 hypothetical protein [Clostridium moniliforme]